MSLWLSLAEDRRLKLKIGLFAPKWYAGRDERPKPSDRPACHRSFAPILSNGQWNKTPRNNLAHLVHTEHNLVSKRVRVI